MVGRDTKERAVANGTTVEETVVSVLTELGSIKKFLLDDLEDVEFTDAKVKAEIRKALDGNYQKIKEGSTLLELSLEPLEGAEAEVFVQYMIPMAAPKFTYRISTGEGEGGRIEGLAVVDNSTEEDLEDFLVTVVNGQPISFTTDLAEIRVPRRGNINVVSDTALGAVDVEEGYEMASDHIDDLGDDDDSTLAMQARPRERTLMRGVRVAGPAAGAAASMKLSEQGRAVSQEAEARDIGDFQLWASATPTTIKARRSALIPLFSQDLPDARPVLIYKPRAHKNHPYRAVRFRNTTGYSLSKGVTSVFHDGVNVGKGILEEAKPDDEKLTPHQLETGVRVVLESSPVEDRLTRINIANGTYVTDVVRTGRSSYVLRNKRDERFQVHLEYDSVLGEGSQFAAETRGDLGQRVEKISTGWRLVMTLEPKEETTVEVTESLTIVKTLYLDVSNVVAFRKTAEDLRDHPQLDESLRLSDEIGRLRADIAEAHVARTAHIDIQKRVNEFLAHAPDGQQRNQWLDDIASSEVSIRLIDRETLPALNNKLREKSEELQAALKKIAVRWDAKAPR